jgi:hypothetical protein
MADRPGPRGILLPLLTPIRDLLWDSLVRVLWRCAYGAGAALAVALLFLGNDQGRDLLRISAERGASLWNLAFLLGAMLLGLANWYTSRLLLARDFPSDGLGRARSRLGRTWLPRLFGAAVPLAIGLGFLRLETAHRWWVLALATLFLLVAAGLLWFFVRRRALFLRGSRRGLEVPVTSLSTLNWALLSGSLAASFLLVAGFVLWPVALPQWFGAPAILLLGFTGIVLFGSLVLTYAFLANGQPAATPLVLVLAVIFGFFNDNHWIRLDPEAPAPQRMEARTHYETWREVNPPPVSIQSRGPVILVAASGGGIRAAYWTASTLATLESVPGFREGLFAISGVSGGSVGAAVYAAVKRRQLQLIGTPATLLEVQQALGQDFLSPVVAGLLFPDLIQRFIPVPFDWADRQRFLELGFERSLGTGPNPLAQSFAGLYAGGYELRIPSLLLNTTVVDSGRRAIVSNIALDGFTDTLDLLAPGFSTRSIRLSAAAGASARFTYVSPAGSLSGPGERDEQKIRLVDGGYFENSGAATAVDLLNGIEGTDLYPILILIRNDPQAPPVCQGRQGGGSLGPGPGGPPAGELLSEVASPVRALLNARTARGRLAEVDAAKRFERAGGAVIEISLAAVAQAELKRTPSTRDRERIKQRLVEPPLGWSLSESVREAMGSTLREGGGGLGAEVAILAAVLSGRTADYVPCGAR